MEDNPQIAYLREQLRNAISELARAERLADDYARGAQLSRRIRDEREQALHRAIRAAGLVPAE